MKTFRECFLNYMEEAFEADLTLSDLKIDNIDKVEKFLKDKLELEGLERFEDVFQISNSLDEGLLDSLSNYFKDNKNALLLAAALSILGWSMSDVVKNFVVLSVTNSACRSYDYSFKSCPYRNVKDLAKEVDENKDADFKCVITLLNVSNEPIQFLGICPGKILEKPYGEHGFGYDPIFYSYEANVPFGLAEENIKNKYSHRAKAVEQLLKYLKENNLIKE